MLKKSDELRKKDWREGVDLEPLVQGSHDFHSITEKVCEINERKTPRAWYIAFVCSLMVLGMLGSMIAYLFYFGTGVWGLQNPVNWGFAIVNFVFWVGIGHAGTLISAVLFLFRQSWRTAINRWAEAMTIFAVMCAGLFPGIHVGRPWLAYWMFPIPNQMDMWPQFKSPLLWDVFAVSTYATVSFLFWYMGMIPDLATLRDRAKGVRRLAYGVFAMGWRGATRHWIVYEKAYMILAALATPLVLSVHTIVSYDFAVAMVPGWHTTIFPPYFVAGAVFSGFGMVTTLIIPARKWFGLGDLVTKRHMDNMCKIMLATGSIVGYAYCIELFIAWYSGSDFERGTFWLRAFGKSSYAYIIMFTCNVFTPQFFWFKKVRENMTFVFILSIFVNIGMWFERYVIVLTLENDFMPSAWGLYSPTIIDVLTLLGSFGLFFTMFLLFVRFLPIFAISEIKGVMPQADPHRKDVKKEDK
jgi:Ni/Fe-hydrogenase subunit HybB-like protein